MKNALFALVFALILSSAATGQCSCVATTTGAAPGLITPNWSVTGAFTPVADLNGTCKVLPACPGPAVQCTHSWVMDFTVTVFTAPGPAVAACISINFGAPVCLGMNPTAFIPPNQFRFIHAMNVSQHCGNNIGGQYMFTEGGIAAFSGFVFMLCQDC